MTKDYRQTQAEMTDLNWDGIHFPDKYFESFCSRMWLDHCDENKDLLGNPLSKKEYVSKYKNWLIDRYEERET